MMPPKIGKKGLFLNGAGDGVFPVFQPGRQARPVCHLCKFFKPIPFFRPFLGLRHKTTGKVPKEGIFWPVFLALPLFFQSDVEVARDHMSGT
jgi:hypothetical protein